MIKLLEEQSAELQTLVCPSPETAEQAGGGRPLPLGQGLQRGLPSLPTKHHSTAGGQPEALCRSIGSPIGSKNVSPPEEAPWPPPPSN